MSFTTIVIAGMLFVIGTYVFSVGLHEDDRVGVFSGTGLFIAGLGIYATGGTV